jgi:hypothetical protein
MDIDAYTDKVRCHDHFPSASLPAGGWGSRRGGAETFRRRAGGSPPGSGQERFCGGSGRQVPEWDTLTAPARSVAV